MFLTLSCVLNVAYQFKQCTCNFPVSQLKKNTFTVYKPNIIAKWDHKYLSSFKQ